jgi:hypothetical protein
MIYLDSTTTISLTGLTDSNGNPINNATVTATITDLDNDLIATVNLASLGSSGNYSGNITPAMTTTMNPQQEYLVSVTSSVGGSVVDFRQDSQLALYRGFNE